MNFLLVGPLYAYFADFFKDNVALGWTLLIAGSTCVMSFICSLVIRKYVTYMYVTDAVWKSGSHEMKRVFIYDI